MTALLPAYIPRRTLPMGRHLPQVGHGLRQGHRRPRLLQLVDADVGARAPVQGQLRVLPRAHYGRGAEHGSSVPDARQVSGRGGARVVQAPVRSSNLLRIMAKHYLVLCLKALPPSWR